MGILINVFECYMRPLRIWYYKKYWHATTHFLSNEAFFLSDSTLHFHSIKFLRISPNTIINPLKLIFRLINYSYNDISWWMPRPNHNP